MVASGLAQAPPNDMMTNGPQKTADDTSSHDSDAYGCFLQVKPIVTAVDPRTLPMNRHPCNRSSIQVLGLAHRHHLQLPRYKCGFKSPNIGYDFNDFTYNPP